MVTTTDAEYSCYEYSHKRGWIEIFHWSWSDYSKSGHHEQVVRLFMSPTTASMTRLTRLLNDRPSIIHSHSNYDVFEYLWAVTVDRKAVREFNNEHKGDN